MPEFSDVSFKGRTAELRYIFQIQSGQLSVLLHGNRQFGGDLRSMKLGTNLTSLYGECALLENKNGNHYIHFCMHHEGVIIAEFNLQQDGRVTDYSATPYDGLVLDQTA